MGKIIQRVEINTNYGTSVFCPYCGQKVSDTEAGEAGEEWVIPCPHTLFVAHDEGFEYRSERFNAQLGLPEDDDDIVLPEKGIDGLTDQASFDDAVKFAAYVGPPSLFGSYVGFTSAAEE
jgi:hypothetical protein